LGAGLSALPNIRCRIGTALQALLKQSARASTMQPDATRCLASSRVAARWQSPCEPGAIISATSERSSGRTIWRPAAH